jgi:hypothetical protein
MTYENQEKRLDATLITKAKGNQEAYQFARNTIPSWCSQPQSCQSDCGGYCKYRDRD